MRRIATHLAAAAAAVVLTGLVAGCSSDSSDTASPTSTVTVTTSASSSGEAAPGTDQPAAGADVDGSGQNTAADTSPPPTPVTVVPPSTFAVGSYYAFGSPSGKIQCRSIEGNFICRTQGNPHTVSSASLCNFYAGQEQSRAVQFGWFTSRPDLCATIIQGEGWSAERALDYGQRVTFPAIAGRTITCSSATDGLTCTQVGGSGARGFFLSADSFTVL